MRLSVSAHSFFALVLRNSAACFAAGDNIVDIRAASRGAPGLDAAKVRHRCALLLLHYMHVCGVLALALWSC